MELNLQASLDSGMPPSLSPDDFDTEPPSNVNDCELRDHLTSLKKVGQGDVTESSMQRLLFKCFRPRFEILRAMNGLDTGLTYEKVVALTSEVNAACSELSTHLPNHADVERYVFKYNMAELLLRRFLLCMHRPLVAQSREDPRYYHSRKITFDSAATLISPAPNESFSNLVLQGGGMFKNRIIHSSLAVSSELLLEMNELRVLSISPPSTYVKMLSETLKEACRQLERRIELGETNTKLHMKLSIVLCRAECIETGVALQQRMVQSAKDSLKRSCATLQALADAAAATMPSDSAAPILYTSFDDENFSTSFNFDDLFQSADFTISDSFGVEHGLC